MRVVHLGKYYPPHRGGIESVTETLCRGLSERGLEVTVVVSNDSRETRDEMIDGVRIVRVGRQVELRSQPLNFGLARCLRSIPCDILHVHTPNPLGALAALQAAPATRIVALHHSDVIRQRLLGGAAAALHCLLYRRAAAVVAATPRHIEHSRLLRAFRERCHVIPFALRKPVTSLGPTWDEALPERWRTEPLALFVGRLVYYKGLEVVLEALTRTRGLNLAVVGTGPLGQRLKASAARLGLERRVCFLDNVGEDRLHALYRACRFLALPSTAPSEAFGMVQLEAMSAGKPVISTRLASGVPFVNQHERTGLIVPPGDPAALASSMQRLARDEALAARLGHGARRRAATDFGVDQVLDLWLELYQRLSLRA